MGIDSSKIRLAGAGFMALVLAMGLGRFAYTPILPMMLDEGLLDIESSGQVASFHFAGYALGAIVAARLPIPPRGLFLASLFAIGASMLAMAAFDALTIWLAARFLAGLCSAFVLVCVSAIIVRALMADQSAKLAGWVFSGVGAGIAAIGLVTIPMMLLQVSSDILWFALGTATVLATIVVSAMTPAAPFQPGVRQARDVCRGPGTPWRLIVPYSAAGFGYIIPATYLPVMAREEIASPLLFGWGWPMFGLAAALSTLAIGRLRAKTSNRVVWVTSQSVMASGLVLPAILPSLGTVIFAAICVGGTFMIVTMAGLTEAQAAATPRDAARRVAAMTAGFAIGQIVGPVAAAWSANPGDGFAMPLLLAATVLVLSLVPLRAVSEPVRQGS